MNIITTKEQLDELVEYYLQQDAFAYDLETVGVRRELPAVNEVMWISLATHGRGDVIPLGHPNGEFISETYPLTGQGEKRKAAGLPEGKLDRSRDKRKAIKTFGPAPEQLFPAEVFKALEPLFFNDRQLIIGHNLIFDLSSIAKYYQNTIPTGPYFDTLLASFVYDNRNTGKLGLDDCLGREFQYSMEKGIGHKVEDYSFMEVAKYAYLDAKYTFLLWKELAPKIEEANVTRTMELEMGVIPVLCSMKLTGATIDTNALGDLAIELEKEIEQARSNIYSTAGTVFNINSNKEKQYILYGPKEEGCRGLKTTVLTGTGKTIANTKGEEALTYTEYSTSAQALESLRNKDALVDALLEYQDLNKLMSTYVIPYLGGEVTKTTNGKAKVIEKDSLLVNGKLYADFIPWGAETGRFSSRNPNLQNVPSAKTKHGKAIRDLFIAPENHKLVVADYSQIEPRILAALCQDPIMLDTYMGEGGGDIYTTIGKVMGVDRSSGKVLVLAMMYGVGPDKIAASFNSSLQAAKDILKQFFETFPSVSEYKNKVIGLARKKGYVTTIMNRRRYLPELQSSSFKEKASAERQAFNTRIQGSAADIIKLAMIRAHEMLPKEAKIILTVHDELVIVTPDEKVDEAREAVRKAMEEVDILPMKFLADISVVQRWGDAD